MKAQTVGAVIHTHTQVNIKKEIKYKNLTILKLAKTNYIRDG